MSATLTPAEASLAGGSLGISFGGSGFLITYFVGVHAILRQLGIINTSTKLAGSSGGSVAAAMGCSNATTREAFLASAVDLSRGCRVTNCNLFLDSVIKSNLPKYLPANVETLCAGKLYVAVTRAVRNPSADPGVFFTSFSSRKNLVNSLAASSYVPRFSGLSCVSSFNSTFVVYDGVGANYLPLLPAAAGVTYTITVSSLATGGAPPNFAYLINNANANPSSLDLLGAPYRPLNPTIQPQPTMIDIYPGLSGPLNLTAAAWNRTVLQAPLLDSTIQTLYDTGRADAAAWVRAKMPNTFTAAAVRQALADTAFKV